MILGVLVGVVNGCTKQARWRVVAHEPVNTIVGAR